MPFGKYSCLDLADLPTSYLSWLLRLEDLGEPLKTAAWDVYRQRFDVWQGQPVATLDFEHVRRVNWELAFKWHRDRGGMKEAMQAVNEFYEALK